MNIKELNKKKVPIVKIDKSLNQYGAQVLFPEKLKKANERLRTIGLPKQTQEISSLLNESLDNKNNNRFLHDNVD